MQIVSIGDNLHNLHELSNRVSEKKEKYFKLSSAENFTQCAKSEDDFMQKSMYILYDTLRKQAYSNILKMLPPKTENFQIKKI